MRNTILQTTAIICLLLSQVPLAKGQLATYTPLNATFNQPITIRINLNLSTDERAKALRGRNVDLYIWMGAGTADNPFAYTPSHQQRWDASGKLAMLHPVGLNQYEISLTPYSFCNVPASANPTVLGILVKNADGTAQTENFTLVQGEQQSLENIVVKSTKPFVEKLADKTVLNVQNDIVSSSGTIFEILQRAPGVSIRNQQTLSMNGKSGVTVLIDGRPTNLGEADLANYLKATPGLQVAAIEIITSPSGKYDAQGNAGIINIKLKKNTQRGLNGSLSGNYQQLTHGRSSLASNGNYRSGKVNVFANAGYNSNLQHTLGSINRKVTDPSGIQKLFLNRTTDIDRGSSHNQRAGLDWFANSKHTFGILYNGSASFNTLKTPGITYIQRDEKLDSGLNTRNNKTTNTQWQGINLNYKYADTTGSELTVDVDFGQYRNNNLSLINTDLFNDKLTNYGRTANNIGVATRIGIGSLRTDYVRQLKRWNGKFEAGLKYSNSQTNNLLEATLLSNGNMVPDTGRSNRFNYSERIAAAYATVGRTQGKWQYQASLRTERSSINGTSTALDGNASNQPDTSYINLFPSAFVRYTPAENYNLGFTITRRINRPNYESLNPFEYLFDNFSAQRGNPYLRPSYSTNWELNYNYKGALDVTAGYSRTTDIAQNIAEQNGDFTLATEYNVGEQHSWYINVSLGMPITKWWYSYNNLSPSYSQYRGTIPSGKIKTNAYGLGWYSGQNFTLKHNWKLQLSSWGNSRTADALFATKWLGSIDLGCSKSWNNNRWNANLAITDLANSQQWRSSVAFANMDFTYRRKWESRGVRLSLSYKFGKTTFKERERKLGNTDERARIK